MKHLKLYEQFDENDPFGEEIEYVKPTFLSWLKNKYPDENTWDKITEIDCYNKQLTSLEGIENLVNLKVLYCDGSQLTDLKGMEKLTNLKRLFCYNNQLTSLEGIENMVNLKLLYCWDNQFTLEYKDYLKNYCKKRKIYLDI